MRHALLAAGLAAFVLNAGLAQAQRVSNVDGRKLMAACTARQASACDAYLDGFADAIAQGGRSHALACVPRAATGTELRDVVLKWLRENPQAQSQKAGQIAGSALAKAYPCQG